MELKTTSQQSKVNQGKHFVDDVACIVSNLLQLEIGFTVTLWQLWCKTDSDKELWWASKRAQRAMAPTTKPNDLSLLPGNHMIEGEHHHVTSTHMITHKHML